MAISHILLLLVLYVGNETSAALKLVPVFDFSYFILLNCLVFYYC